MERRTGAGMGHADRHAPTAARSRGSALLAMESMPCLPALPLPQVGYAPTLADIACWAQLQLTLQWDRLRKAGSLPHLARW